MAKARERYICSSCGAQTSQWMGRCPRCQEWNTLQATAAEPRNGKTKSGNRPIPLANAPDDVLSSFKCGLNALDNILGDGLHKGASILIGGEPGIGKSTLILQMAGGVAANGMPVLYASGEEGLAQIRARAERLGALTGNLAAISTSRLEDVLQALEAEPPALLILDSIQTIASSEVEGLPGNVSQVRASTAALLEKCRELGVALVIVGHVTKDGSIAGPRLLEHMVDTVISLEGDRRQSYSMLRVFKNRFGPNEDLLVLRMKTRGLEVVEDPSTFFLNERDPALSGASLVMALDGRKPFVVETQALVTRSYFPMPKRTAVGFDVNRLHLLLAVMEKRLKLNFSQVDIYAKVGGGFILKEPGLDLALVAAILSSYYDLALPEKAIFWGEVDLNGQIRPAAGHDRRISQAVKLGFSPIVSSGPGANDMGGSLAGLRRGLFGRGGNGDRD
ncbi:MAG: DNA repair protein RadA [Desulfovibrio sp.]|nr:DNA repair protein RadA [Desulfovibrio sp.]